MNSWGGSDLRHKLAIHSGILQILKEANLQPCWRNCCWQKPLVSP